jgi:hypothetical protein
MGDDSLIERIRLNAEAARIPLGPDSPARIARAVAPTVARLATERLSVPLEVEPSSFRVVQRRESGHG